MSCPRRVAPLLAVLALVGCGNLPRPFSVAGSHPRRLAQPPPARLAIPSPPDALLPDAASAAFSDAVVAALVAREVPAVAGPAREGDWRLVVSAELRGDKVVPAYTVENPKGEAKGTAQGHPIDAASWSEGGHDTLQLAAAGDAGSIASLLTSIEAARQRSDPNSLVNRSAKIFVKGVSGAPGDGDQSLARNLRDLVPKQGEVLVDNGEEADFVVEAKVRAEPGKAGTTRIEIQWIVSDAAGHERGRIIQLNEVPPQAVDGLWGDVAQVAAQEAASGIRDVVRQQNAQGAPTASPAAGAKPQPGSAPSSGR